MMMWKQLLVASALVCGSSVHALFIDGCPDGTFPVSVLDDPQVHCLSGSPCSGVYSSSGLPQGVGACPANTGCALLPQNPSVMGCVAAGRGDVTYVNADGTLTKDGKVVAPATTAPLTTTTATTTESSKKTDANGNLDGSDQAESGKTPSTSTDSKDDQSAASPSPSMTSSTGSKKSSSSGSAGNLKGSSSKSSSGSTDTVSSPTPTPTPAPTPAPTPSASIEQVNAQQTLNDINGDTKSASDTGSSSGFGVTSIIMLVVGCLAVVAIVAGVRLLKKDKEAVVETPEGNLDDYGGGITPKENVVLL